MVKNPNDDLKRMLAPYPENFCDKCGHHVSKWHQHWNRKPGKPVPMSTPNFLWAGYEKGAGR